MGKAPCAIIISEGNNSYAATEILAKKYPHYVETTFLQAAIQASCSEISYASLYFTIEKEESKLSSEYTLPIIQLHERIFTELPLVSKHDAQRLVDELAEKLMKAVRNLYKLFED